MLSHLPNTQPLSPAYLNRFGGIARLYGNSALEALAQAHMLVIGMGGVGTWAAEALARSGVGELTLIDMDEVCVTNTNRQAHALASTLGQTKTQVMAQRLRDINPELRLHGIDDFLSRENMRELIGTRHHVVIDAMDAAHLKAALVAYCLAIKVRLITLGSSGGKRDPQRVRIADLGHTQGDAMLQKMRTQLFRHHHFDRTPNRKFRVDAIYSDEQMVYPKPDGSVCMTKQHLQDGVRLDCTGGFGSSMMVTASFGLLAANRAIERYLEKVLPSASSSSSD